MKDRDKIIKIAEFYGASHQHKKLIEELGELSRAVNELERWWDKTVETGDRERIKTQYYRKLLNHVAEEMADVRIMIDQIEYLARLEDETAKQREFKLDRQLKRIAKEEEEYEEERMWGF